MKDVAVSFLNIGDLYHTSIAFTLRHVYCCDLSSEAEVTAGINSLVSVSSCRLFPGRALTWSLSFVRASKPRSPESNSYFKLSEVSSVSCTRGLQAFLQAESPAIAIATGHISSPVT